MGLDMYLTAEVYIGGYDHSGEEQKARFRAALEAAGLSPEMVSDDSPHVSMEVCVAYWRKANAIHGWFVEHVQSGEDDCDSYAVSREQLAELRDTCKRALATAQIAEGQPNHVGTTYYGRAHPERPGEIEQHIELGRAALNGEELAKILPTQPGFFFGGTDYDEGYLEDLENTIKQIDRVLALPDRLFFSYRASW